MYFDTKSFNKTSSWCFLHTTSSIYTIYSIFNKIHV